MTNGSRDILKNFHRTNFQRGHFRGHFANAKEAEKSVMKKSFRKNFTRFLLQNVQLAVKMIFMTNGSWEHFEKFSSKNHEDKMRTKCKIFDS